MTKTVADSVKIGADVGTGVTIATVTDTNSLIVTAITIICRLIIDVIINRKTRGKNELQ